MIMSMGNKCHSACSCYLRHGGTGHQLAIDQTLDHDEPLLWFSHRSCVRVRAAMVRQQCLRRPHVLQMGVAIIITGLIGFLLPQKLWITHAFAALVMVLVGLSISVCKTLQYADRLKRF